jgi:hypothetical protein
LGLQEQVLEVEAVLGTTSSPFRCQPAIAKAASCPCRCLGLSQLDRVFWGPLRAPGRPGVVAPVMHDAVVVSQELLLVAEVLMLVAGT